MKNKTLLIIVMMLVLTISNASAAILSDQGTGVINKTSGLPLGTGDLTVQIWDSLTGGTNIYSHTFPGAIVNGSWDLLIGESPGPAMNLSYGEIYYKDYAINGEDATFLDNSGSSISRLKFQSPVGPIDASYIIGLSVVTNETDPIWLTDKSDYYTSTQVDNLISGANTTIYGNESVFDGWDKNAADDFDGLYSSLTGTPINVSQFINDAGYLTSYTDTLTTLGCIADEYALYNGSVWDCETKPVDGTDITISNIIDNGDGTYTWQFSDGYNYTTGDLTGPTGPQGNQGNQGYPGLSVVVDVNNESTGTNCANGGQQIDFYRDTNNDGIYQFSTDFPLLGTAYACKGDQGIQGPQGIPGPTGTDGEDGYTPYIQNDYWFINGTNTTIKATGTDGINGTSFDVAGDYLYDNGSNVIFFNDSNLPQDFDNLTYYGLTTGLIEGGIASINSTDPSYIDVTGGTSLYVDMNDPTNPIVEKLTFPGASLYSNLTGKRLSWVVVERVSPGVGQLVIKPTVTPEERRTMVRVAKFWSNDGTDIIVGKGQYTVSAYDGINSVKDFFDTIGSTNKEGNIYYFDGGLTLAKTRGESFRFTSNYDNDPLSPNQVIDSAQTSITNYAYHIQDQTYTISKSSIDPQHWDNAGVLDNVSSDKYTIQRIYYFPVGGTTHITYGQYEYDTLFEAIQNLNADHLNLNMDILDGSILRGWMVLKEGITDFTDDTESLIFTAQDVAVSGLSFYEGDPLFMAYINANPNIDLDSTDDFNGAFNNLSGIPTGLSDGDNDTLSSLSCSDSQVIQYNSTSESWQCIAPLSFEDTTLNETQVDAFVANNGYLTNYTETDPVFIGSTAYDISASNVSNWNTAFGWGDHALAGYLTSYTETDPLWTAVSADYVTYAATTAWDKNAADDFDGAFSSLTGVPTGLADGDDNTQLNETQVDAFVANNGYLTNYTETDTLDDVTGRGATTTNSITVNNVTIASGECISGASGGAICFNSTHTWII